ncbi:xylose isomerase-like protein [Aureobasidium subglaciale]|nr:xylose isomerase-like protein [Aureobasidium subglaciale]
MLSVLQSFVGTLPILITLTMKTLSNKLAIATPSLGLHESHSLDRKIRAASEQGFAGIEIVFGELEKHSRNHCITIDAAARAVRQMCDIHSLEVISLCPFEDFEGSRTSLEARLAKASLWLDIARILGATFIQVPSQFDIRASRAEDVIVRELQQLADLASFGSPVVKIAYEPMSWGICYPTWETALRLANLVDRPNFGICLDTFHIGTRLWGSPLVASGKYLNADAHLADSLRRFVAEFPLEKLFFVQLSDAELLDPPLSTSHPWYVEGEAAEFTWSKHARPFPLENDMGGYLPVAEILKAWVADKGFTGWISFESFDRRMADESYDPKVAAVRARQSWQKILPLILPARATL